VSDHATAASWVAGCERAWRTAGTELLRELFTDDATYRQAPFDPPIAGLAAISQMWERERAGPDEQFTMSSEVVAVEGNVAVVRAEVRYEAPSPHEYRDLWIMHFADDGRCLAFEEWPFWPGQARAVSGQPGT
jgi:ketosteroid isomerase-like protein